jgi:GDP-L-fucose synthase
LAALVGRIVGFRGRLDFDDSKPDGTLRKLTDVSRLHALGWQHSVNLEEGVTQLYQWYLGNSST